MALITILYRYSGHNITTLVIRPIVWVKLFVRTKYDEPRLYGNGENGFIVDFKIKIRLQYMTLVIASLWPWWQVL